MKFLGLRDRNLIAKWPYAITEVSLFSSDDFLMNYFDPRKLRCIYVIAETEKCNHKSEFLTHFRRDSSV